MTDLLSQVYPWTKAFHIISVIAWMAGLFYLPRLFVYHAEKGSEHDPVFREMEHKLLRVIMNPASVASWVFGLSLVFTPGIVDWAELWPWVKAAAVLAMTWFHFWLWRRQRDFARGANKITGRQYRIMNEVPTVLMIVIVLAVVIRF